MLTIYYYYSTNTLYAGRASLGYRQGGSLSSSSHAAENKTELSAPKLVDCMTPTLPIGDIPSSRSLGQDNTSVYTSHCKGRERERIVDGATLPGESRRLYRSHDQ